MLIKPIDILQIDDPQIDGSNGTNRVPHDQSQIKANNDIEAAKEFISIQNSSSTKRSYQKEIERLILWSINVKSKPISSLSTKDLEEYFNFLVNPEPSDIWCSSSKHPRNSDDWRPFLGGLGQDSIKTAISIIASFYFWLLHNDYLQTNPMRKIGATRNVRKKQVNPISLKTERYLDSEMILAILQSIENLQKESSSEKAKYERARFIFALISNLVPYPSELSAGRMSDFFVEDDLLWWKAHKGKKVTKVIVNESMRKALIRYRIFLGLPPIPSMNDDSPILRSLNKNGAITVRQLNNILDELFEKAAALLDKQADSLKANSISADELKIKATKLRNASADWMRLSPGKHGYDYIDNDIWHAEMQKLSSY